MAYDFDLLVIGAGSGGVRAARMAAAKGVKVAIVEEKYLGGTCVNVGCVPKKLLAYAAHYADDFADAKGFGWQVGETNHNWSTLIHNKNIEIQRLNQIYLTLLEKAGVTVLNGRATLRDAHTVTIVDKTAATEKTLTAEKILIAVGGTPVKPECIGSEQGITSDQAFYLTQRPQRIAIVGGGYIAVEFASIFHGLGSEVHVLYRGKQLLKNFDHGAANFAVSEMQKKGIHIHLNTEIQSMKAHDNAYRCELNQGEPLLVDEVMFATGRKPLTAKLGLQHTRVQLQPAGTIIVNEQFQTAEPSIFALGDVIGTPELTPVALEQAMVFVDQQYGSQQRRMSYDAIPTTVFCQPNMATVGLSEEQVLEQGLSADVYLSEFRPLKHTLSGSSERMMMKMLVAKNSQKLLGVHIVGAEAGEILQGFAVAVKAGLTKQQVDATIGIHPTAAEELVTLRDVKYSLGD
jgi:glutathione reductase (NADPH)